MEVVCSSVRHCGAHVFTLLSVARVEVNVSFWRVLEGKASGDDQKEALRVVKRDMNERG